MAGSPLLFTIITNNIYSNPSPHMVVPFLLVPLHLKKMSREVEEKGKDRNQEISSTKENKKLDATPNIF